MGTETPTLAQDGTFDNDLGTYSDATQPTVGIQEVACLRFTGASTPTEMIRYTSATLSLTIDTWASDTLPTRLRVFAVREATPAVWATANPPGFFTLGGSATVPVIQAQLNLGQIVELDDTTHTTVPSSPLSISLDLGALSSLASLPSWAGAFNFFIAAQLPSGASDIVFANSPTLTVVSDLRNLTGISTSEETLGRISECPVCGRPSPRDHWVRDGFRKIFLCAECFDPDDVSRTVRRPPTPLINEG